MRTKPIEPDYTCPIIDGSISEFEYKVSREKEYIEDFISNSMKDIEKEYKSQAENLRETNSKLRDYASDLIDYFDDMIEDFKSEIDTLVGKLISKEKEIERLEEKISEMEGEL